VVGHRHPDGLTRRCCHSSCVRMPLPGHMDEIVVIWPMRRMGGSLALIVPPEAAMRANVTEGVSVVARISVCAPHPFGLLKGIAKVSFDRRDQKQWHDRL